MTDILIIAGAITGILAFITLVGLFLDWMLGKDDPPLPPPSHWGRS